MVGAMEFSRRDLLKTALTAAAVSGAKGAPVQGYLKPVEAHLTKLIETGTDVYGPMKTPMWMASLDTKTGRYPDKPYAKIGQRVYREIASPKGCSLYWDQPEIVAAYAMTGITGNPLFKKASDDYIKSFLERGVDENGLWEWGNHRYYDAFTDKFVRFAGGPHEMRPITPAWDIFWKLAPQVTEREIRVLAVRHLFDPAAGGFNRHDDGKKGDAFLEAGGVLTESLCWLSKKKDDRSLAETAMKIAHFSFDNRDRNTGLVENQPTQVRWDKFVCTTEIGMWAAAMLRAADSAGKAEFSQMADEAMSAYLKYGYDAKAGEYYGQVTVKDGTPPTIAKTVVDPNAPVGGNYTHKVDGTKADDYFPGHYADMWNALFPTHDYPMVFAETCVELYRRTNAERYREAVDRWVGVIQKHPAPTTAKDGHGAYAELFGRAIFFLTDAGATLAKPQYTAMARKLADSAISTLFAYGMFRSHASEDRYDSVDGVGYLLLALIYLETGKKPDFLGFGG
jgi:hypothetical protein